jgi:hypothetical protein
MEFLFELGGWVFTGLLIFMIVMPIYWKHKDRIEDKKIKEYNRGYYEQMAKKTGLDLKFFGY